MVKCPLAGDDESGNEFHFTDIIYESHWRRDSKERRNALRPLTIKELSRAFDDARNDSSVGVIILTGKWHTLQRST
ncbi:1,4-dihydroxy-2-naphthoyl-CoA synthase, peroxisomal [Quercus suber]|uniref:1,4-dihydroxy-2-naphthoyl-CoA synthase, peroxisomal n=1 Tax=Quercus suber TaxID=58331 RepID=A0AAW0JS65_QUESU